MRIQHNLLILNLHYTDYTRIIMNLKADEQLFKSNIKSTCKLAEQDFVNALTHFHQSQINSSKNKLIQGKRPKKM